MRPCLLEVDTAHLALPSWKPTLLVIEKAVQDLAQLVVEISPTEHIIIFQMLDSAVFYVRIEEGTLILQDGTLVATSSTWMGSCLLCLRNCSHTC